MLRLKRRAKVSRLLCLFIIVLSYGVQRRIHRIDRSRQLRQVLCYGRSAPLLCILLLEVAVKVDDEALVFKRLSIVGHALRIERRLRPAGLQILKLFAVPNIKYEMLLIVCHLQTTGIGHYDLRLVEALVGFINHYIVELARGHVLALYV